MSFDRPPASRERLRLRLDAEFALYYGLPRELPFALDPEIDPGTAGRVDLKALTTGLEEARRRGEALDPAVLSFLANWPEIEKMERFLAVGNPAFAGRIARELERRDPGRPCVAFALGVAASREDDFDTAADALETCLQSCPGHVPALQELATVLALGGSWDGALLLLDRLDAVSPASGGSGLYRRAMEMHSAEEVREIRARVTALGAAGRSGDREQVLAAVETLIGAAPQNAEAHRLAALSLRAAGDRARARPLAEKAARLDPRSAAANLTLARIAVETGDFLEAERAALKARSLLPDSSAPILAQASALRADGRPGQAALILKQASLEHPDEVNLNKLEAVCLLEAGRAAESRDVLLKIAERDPFDPAALYNLARASEALKDTAAARAAYDAALSRAPRFAAAREARALLDFREGDAAAARRSLEALVREQPDSPHGYRGLGDLALDTDAAGAARWYEEALERRPDFVCSGLLYLAGIKALLEKDYAGAETLFENSVRADARRHRAWCNLGVARFHAGKLEGAIFAMEEAAALDPAEPGYQENLGAFYRVAFWRHPLKNFRFLGMMRRAKRRGRERRNAGSGT